MTKKKKIFLLHCAMLCIVCIHYMPKSMWTSPHMSFFNSLGSVQVSSSTPTLTRFIGPRIAQDIMCNSFGPFTSNERIVMQQHTRIAYKIVSFQFVGRPPRYAWFTHVHIFLPIQCRSVNMCKSDFWCLLIPPTNCRNMSGNWR